VRLWKDQPVSEELILKAIELATYAPNGGNQQNWHFYVILNRETIKSIAGAVQASAETMASWPEAAKFGDTFPGMVKKSGFFRNAPVAIAVAASQYQSAPEQLMALREDFDPKAREMREWRGIANSKIQYVSSAIAYLLLILHEMGLGAVWMTGPIQVKSY
jgi:nitroreductase